MAFSSLAYLLLPQETFIHRRRQERRVGGGDGDFSTEEGVLVRLGEVDFGGAFRCMEVGERMVKEVDGHAEYEKYFFIYLVLSPETLNGVEESG